MSIRGKIKTVKDPVNSRISGTVNASGERVEYNFDQQYGVQLGIAKDSVVQFELVTKSDGTVVAVSLDPVDKGIIDFIGEKGDGVIIETSGNKLNFQQDYAKELGLVAGVKVKYNVVCVEGKYLATSLKLNS